MILYTAIFVIALKLIEVHRIEGVCARSLIRAWHKLHVERLITHDFTDLLAPRHTANTDVYYAAIRHDDVRAIAIVSPYLKKNKTDRNVSLFQVTGMSHAPDEVETACSLIAEIVLTKKASLVIEKLPARWRYEASFVSEDAIKTTENVGDDKPDDVRDDNVL